MFSLLVRQEFGKEQQQQAIGQQENSSWNDELSKKQTLGTEVQQTMVAASKYNESIAAVYCVPESILILAAGVVRDWKD